VTTTTTITVNDTTNSCGPFGCDETTSTTTGSTNSSQHAVTTTLISGDCITSFGTPQGAFFRVLYDSNSSPVVAVSVVATPTLTYDCYAYRTSFTTNGSEWYALDYQNAGSFLIKVNYLGHNYNVTMSLAMSDFNCGTLYLPSGKTNVTSTPSLCTV
jgi:hypothetical protein